MTRFVTCCGIHQIWHLQECGEPVYVLLVPGNCTHLLVSSLRAMIDVCIRRLAHFAEHLLFAPYDPTRWKLSAVILMTDLLTTSRSPNGCSPGRHLLFTSASMSTSFKGGTSQARRSLPCNNPNETVSSGQRGIGREVLNATVSLGPHFAALLEILPNVWRYYASRSHSLGRPGCYALHKGLPFAADCRRIRPNSHMHTRRGHQRRKHEGCDQQKRHVNR